MARCIGGKNATGHYFFWRGGGRGPDDFKRLIAHVGYDTCGLAKCAGTHARSCTHITLQTYSHTDSLTPYLNRSHSTAHSLTHPVTHSRTHSLTHSKLTHPHTNLFTPTHLRISFNTQAHSYTRFQWQSHARKKQSRNSPRITLILNCSECTMIIIVVKFYFTHVYMPVGMYVFVHVYIYIYTYTYIDVY